MRSHIVGTTKQKIQTWQPQAHAKKHNQAGYDVSVNIIRRVYGRSEEGRKMKGGVENQAGKEIYKSK